MQNALTVDVEDYFHVQSFAGQVDPTDWPHFESRVERNTERLLALLAERGVRATFFVLGWVAQRHPALVRRIAEGGHELGSHSQWHRLVYSLTPESFREDLRQSKATLEDTAGQPVTTYRAPSWSVTRRTPWFFEILREEGILLDSSIFPIQHDVYGWPESPRFPYRIQTAAGPLDEFPASTIRLWGANLPISGGGYFRLLPGAVSRWGLKTLNQAGCPAVFYIHPWELDPQQPRLRGVPWKSRFRHYTNLHTTQTKLAALLDALPWTTLSESLAQYRSPRPTYAIDRTTQTLSPCSSADRRDSAGVSTHPA